MSRRACEVLAQADTLVGYTTYIDLIRPLIKDQEVISTGMTREVERVTAAIDSALGGKTCVIVCSGDPGIYAMAGLVYEICNEKNIHLLRGFNDPESASNQPRLTVEIIPGIPALCAGAALLGAPLTHDFAVISLSDLLTPWKLIEARLEAAARADFVIVIYNPKSRRRSEHLARAQQILLQHRDGRTPVGVVSRAMRSGQRVEMTSLAEMHRAAVDMQTTLFVGSRQSFQYLDFMVTPRGYAAKYNLKDGQ
jgi:precorrin-3B C17-methyltransferase